MAQATSGKIVCSNWLKRVTCRSVFFRNGPVPITGFVSHFVYKGTTIGNFEKPQKFNEFSKLSAKSCELDDEQSKREFYYHESNNNKNNNVEK